MLYRFPAHTYAMVMEAYPRPYETPIEADQGEVIQPLTGGSMQTDFMGWTWCIANDGRAGWVPNGWCEPSADGWKLLRDYSALEHSVRRGDRLRLIFSESGFVFCEADSGEQAWLPDAVLALDSNVQGM